MDDLLSPASLKSARLAAGLTVAQLADRCGIHKTTITRIEKGDVDPRVGSTWGPIVRALTEVPRKRKTRSTSEGIAA